MHIERNLVVTAACGMQTSAGAADTFGQTRFYIHMNVLQRNVKMEVACFNISQDVFQTGNNLLPVFCRNDTAFSQHTGMSNAAADILVI